MEMEVYYVKINGKAQCRRGHLQVAEAKPVLQRKGWRFNKLTAALIKQAKAAGLTGVSVTDLDEIPFAVPQQMTWDELRDYEAYRPVSATDISATVIGKQAL
jgi:hypothetical protein